MKLLLDQQRAQAKEAVTELVSSAEVECRRCTAGLFHVKVQTASFVTASEARAVDGRINAKVTGSPES